MQRTPAFGQLRENASRGRGVAVHKVIAALLVGGLAQAYMTEIFKLTNVAGSLRRRCRDQLHRQTF